MLVNRITAWLPYEVPGTSITGLNLDIKLDKLTVLVGPNASGKTAILESIGYMLAPHQKSVDDALLSLTLTSTLRPDLSIPRNFAVKGEINGKKVSSAYVEATPSLLFEKSKLEFLSEFIDANLEREFERDLQYMDKFEPFYSRNRNWPTPDSPKVHKLIKAIREVVGENPEMSISRAKTRMLRSLSKREAPRAILHVLRFLKEPPILVYTADNENLMKSIVVHNVFSYLMIRERKENRKSYIQLAVFHPGFTYWRGMFEGVYHFKAQKGMPNEKEANEIVREYIEWFNGCELFEGILHVRDDKGKRIPLYSLSDGYRVVVLLGLLYAISEPPTLFLIDTPEAFVHPDGVPIVADVIVRLVSDGNQVVLATQSIEFLEILLDKAKEYEILENTSILKIALTTNGQIKYVGKWKGSVALRSIEELGIDLRR